MKMVRTGGAAVLVATMLAVAACGSDEGDSSKDSSASNEPAGIRLWLNGTDTPQELRDYLVETFAKQNKGSTLTIEEQDWNGLVPRLQTALASEDQTPDLVEIGNTQSPTFTYAGAFADITDMVGDLGGDDLLQGFLAAGTVDDTVYAVPYYSGARAVFYNKEMFQAAGVEVPTTLEEFSAAAEKLQGAKPADAASF